MVSKCANPVCTASFRYFHTGQLFRLDSSTASASDSENGMNPHAPRLEFFWLCDDCAANLTLTFQKGVGVSIHPKMQHSAAAA